MIVTKNGKTYGYRCDSCQTMFHKLKHGIIMVKDWKLLHFCSEKCEDDYI